MLTNLSREEKHIIQEHQFSRTLKQKLGIRKSEKVKPFSVAEASICDEHSNPQFSALSIKMQVKRKLTAVTFSNM